MPRSFRMALVVAALSIVGPGAGVAASPQQSLTPVENHPPAPDLVLEAAAGGKVKLSDFHGKVVLVNFWATWCPPCKREMPTLDRLGRSMQGRSFAIVGINAGEELEDVLGYRMTTGHAPSFPLFLDRKGEALKAFGVKGLPTTFIIDRQGRIAYKALGGRNFEDPALVARIRALVGKP